MSTSKILAAFAGALVFSAVGCANSAPSSAPSSTPPAAADRGAGSVCTPGMDQTCNDNPEISSLHGACQPDGTCACKVDFAKNPATGRCK